MDYKVTSNGIQIKYDTQFVDKLFNYLHGNYKKLKLESISYNGKKNFKYCPWDRMCAIASRLYDTLHYMNDKNYHSENRGKAFDFYEFLNNAYIIIHCSETLAEIMQYSDELDGLKTKLNYFKDYNFVKSAKRRLNYYKQLNNPKANKKQIISDYDCFQYLRSLCAVHPEDITQGSNIWFLKKTDIHCCPYVIWSDFIKDELWIYVYDSYKKQHYEPVYKVSFRSIAEYVNEWLIISKKVMEEYNIVKNETCGG